jgi:hypothetical protein
LTIVTAFSTAVVGCSTIPDPDTGAVVVSPAHARYVEPAPIGEFDLDRVDPRFSRAVADYTREVARLRAMPDIDRAAGLPRAIRILAEAIDSVPHSLGDPVVFYSVHAMRMDTDAMFLAAPTASPMADTLGAVATGSNALLHLAGGPYRAAPDVRRRVNLLEQRLSALRGDRRLRTSRADLLEALEQAALVLTAIHTALATGVVD